MTQVAALLRAPFEIANDRGERATTMDEGRQATDGQTTVLLLESEGKMFRRRGFKPSPEGGWTPVEWLVVQVNGLNVYVGHDQVIISKEDMYP